MSQGFGRSKFGGLFVHRMESPVSFSSFIPPADCLRQKGETKASGTEFITWDDERMALKTTEVGTLGQVPKFWFSRACKMHEVEIKICPHGYFAKPVLASWKLL